MRRSSRRAGFVQAIACSLAAAAVVVVAGSSARAQGSAACIQGPASAAGGAPGLWVTYPGGGAPLATPPFRVWAECAPGAQSDAAAHADAAAAAAVVESLWQPMTTLMGPPIPDAGGADEGGDPAIDFYLLAPGRSVSRGGETHAIGTGEIAFARASEPRNTPTASGFVLMNRGDIQRPAFRGFIAHEFFHVLQNAHNLDTTLRNDEYHWFVEASAMWAQLYFDPAGAPPYVHPAFTDYFQPAQESLHSTDVDHTYASYVWPIFMQQEKGAAAVAAAWRAMAAAQTWDDLNDAIDQQLPFGTHFRDFALRNVNDGFDGQNVIGRRYVDLVPSFPDGTRPWELAETIDAAGGRFSQSFPVDLPSLTAAYHRYTVSGASEVTFDFSGLQPSGDLHVDALVKIAGSGWEPAPRRLPGGGSLRFCLDRPEEDVEQVYLVLSNQQKREESLIQGGVDVEASSEPCEEEREDPILTGDWRGTVRVVHTIDMDDNTLGVCQDLNPLNGEVMVRYPCGARTQTYARKTFTYNLRGDDTEVVEARYDERYIIQTCSPQNDPKREESICTVNWNNSNSTNIEDEAGMVSVSESPNGDGTYEIIAGTFFALTPPVGQTDVLVGSDSQSVIPENIFVISWSLSRGSEDPPPPPDPCDAVPEACGPPPEEEPFPEVTP